MLLLMVAFRAYFSVMDGLMDGIELHGGWNGYRMKPRTHPALVDE